MGRTKAKGVKKGDCFVDEDRGRTVRVLHVATAGKGGVRRAGALCVTRSGKLTKVSVDRLADAARYVRVGGA